MHSPAKAENKYTPTELRIYNEMVAAVRVRHESYKTGQAYGEDVVRYYRFLQSSPALRTATPEERVNAYLTHISPRVAAKTQNQHLCAIKRYYEQVLKKPLGDLGKWAYAKRPERTPVWLNQTETNRLLDCIPGGTFNLMARVCYGSGLRLMELMRLRQQHIDLEKRTLFIMGGSSIPQIRVATGRARQSLSACLTGFVSRLSLLGSPASSPVGPFFFPAISTRKSPAGRNRAGRESRPSLT